MAGWLIYLMESLAAAGVAIFFALLQLRVEFTVDLCLMVEVVGHGRMGLGQGEVGMLPAHFFRRPTVREIVGDDLRYPNAWDAD